MTIPRRFKKPEAGREFPRDVMLKLPSAEECCTVEETIFWNQTMQLAQSGKRPREVAEFAASGLDDPMLVRAYPVIREAMRKWAAMGDVWQEYSHNPLKPSIEEQVVESWYDQNEPFPAA
jgi:hypothetical protein